MNRSDAVSLAGVVLDELSARLDARGRAMIDLGSGSIDVIAAAVQPLRGALADHFQSLPGAPLLGARVEEWLRLQAYEARRRAIREWSRLRGFGTWPRAIEAEHTALAIPRAANHLRDMRLVARYAERCRTLSFRWLTFRTDQLELLREDGASAVLAEAYARASLQESLRVRAELSSSCLLWRSDPPPALPASAWPATLRAIHRQAQRQVPYVLAAAAPIRRALDALAPAVVVVGNPTTTEGTVAVAAARARGVATVAMQHGLITRDQPEYARSGVDLLTVWGADTADTLAELGVPSGQAAITGAPWVDALVTGGVRARGARPRVLVAMSGAGHLVGMAEHLAYVRRLFEAAAVLVDHDWVFRLHPKDDPAIYHRAHAEFPAARAEICGPSSARPDIHEQLRAADLLITVSSTSALDAMLQGVPVLALERPPGEVRPNFVEAGATAFAPVGEDLAALVERLNRGGFDPDIARRAREFVEGYFGVLDGGATARVATAVENCVARSRLGARPRAKSRRPRS